MLSSWEISTTQCVTRASDASTGLMQMPTPLMPRRRHWISSSMTTPSRSSPFLTKTSPECPYSCPAVPCSSKAHSTRATLSSPLGYPELREATPSTPPSSETTSSVEDLRAALPTPFPCSGSRIWLPCRTTLSTYQTAPAPRSRMPCSRSATDSPPSRRPLKSLSDLTVEIHPHFLFVI